MQSIPSLINYLKGKNISYEIIIIDDGSNDGGETRRVAEGLNCTYLENETNLGKGATVKKGMLYAKGDFRIFTDVDIPFEHEAIERFLNYLDHKEFDLVVGDRTLPDSSYFKETSSTRKLGSNVFSFIAGRFVSGGYFDTQCGMKGFRAKAAEDIFSVAGICGFAFDVELLYIALKRNYDIKRLPVTLRSNDTSSVKVLRHGMKMLFDLFRIPSNNIRGKYKKR